jgi:outer membrane receptor for ferrienterochelin and colicins
MKKLLIILLLLTSTLLCKDDELYVRGKILDKNGNPIEKAIVIIPEIGLTCETDKNGFFEIKARGGKIHLEIQKEGYIPYQSEILEIKESVNLEIILFPSIEEEIVVTATKVETPIKEVPVRTEVISSKEIEESGGKTLYEILNKKGIGLFAQQSCSNCNFTQLRMQGLEGGYTQVLIDGQPIFEGLASVYGLQQIGSENIQQIEIVKGASSSLYGAQAVGGVINIITKEPGLKPEINLEGRLGNWRTRDLSLHSSFRKGFFGFLLTAQKENSDFFDQNNDGFTDKVGRENLNLSLKTNFYIKEDTHRVSVFSRYIDEFRRGGFIATIDDPFDEYSEHIKTKRYEYGMSYRGIFSNRSILRVNISGTEHKRDATNSSRPFHSEEINKYFEIQYSSYISNHTLTTGISFKNQRVDEIINLQKAPEKEAKILGVYLQDELNAGRDIDLIFGIRYDRTKSTFIKASSLSPRIAIKWSLNPKNVLRASIGTGFRVPYLFSEDLHLCSSAPLIYNPGTLKPERSISYSLSWEKEMADFYFEASIFRTDISRKIYFTEKDVPPGFDFVYVNGGNAFTQGIELRGRKEIGLLNVEFGFSFIDARYKEEQDYGVGRSRRIMRTPIFSGLINFEYSNRLKGLSALLTGHLTGNQYIENIVQNRIDRTPTYSTWDFSISKTIFSHWIITAGVDNIFNYVQKVRFPNSLDSAYIYAPLVGRYFYAGLRYKY